MRAWQIVCVLVLALLTSGRAAAVEIAKVSVADPTVGDGAPTEDAWAPSLSATGRYVAFESMADSLVRGDHNQCKDVFRVDRQTGETVRVSLSEHGTELRQDSFSPSISGDGRRVAFCATDAVYDGVYGQHVYVRDVQDGRVWLVDRKPDGDPIHGSGGLVSISEDGTAVAFQSGLWDGEMPGAAVGFSNVLVRDLDAGTTVLANLTPDGQTGADGDSRDGVLSADGRLVAFMSRAGNLVADDGNGVWDVFLRDLDAGTTILVSRSPLGVAANGESFSPSISPDGRYVAFVSLATDLTPYPTNGRSQIYLYDRDTGATRMVSRTGAGLSGDGDAQWPVVSRDGTRVAFLSNATNLCLTPANGNRQVLVRDMTEPLAVMVSVSTTGQASGRDVFYPDMSADGAVVGFNSDATDLVVGRRTTVTDVFVRELPGGPTTRVNNSFDRLAANGASDVATCNADGRLVAFRSYASNLVPDDGNEVADVFVRDVVAGRTWRISVSSTGVEANGESYESLISADGSCVVFTSAASNLVDGSPAGINVFRHDLRTGETILVSPVVVPDAVNSAWAVGCSVDGRHVLMNDWSGAMVAGGSFGQCVVRDIEAGTTTIVSVTPLGAPSGGISAGQSISADGGLVLFGSDAGDLVAGDDNGWGDLFIRDMRSGTTTRVVEAHESGSPMLTGHVGQVSGDGTRLVIDAQPDYLLPDDWNGFADVFSMELETGAIERVSLDPDGYPYRTDAVKGCISQFGDRIAYVVRPNADSEIRLQAMDMGTTRQINVPYAGVSQGAVTSLAMSAQGRHVVFAQNGSWMTADDSSSLVDVFIARLAEEQRIDWVVPDSVVFSPDPVALTATASSGLAVTYSLVDGPAEIRDGAMYLTGAGDVTIQADQAGDSIYYAAARVTRTIHVTKATATIHLAGLRAVMDGQAHAVSISTDPPGLTVEVTYDGSATPPSGIGGYAVEADVVDDDYQGHATGTLTLKYAQSISWTAPDSVPYSADPFQPDATASSGFAVTYTVLDGPAVVVFGDVYLMGTGDLTIAADQAGDNTYYPAERVTRTIHVGKGTASIFLANLSAVADGKPHAVSAITDPPGLSVTVTYDGSVIPPSGVGSYAVLATVEDGSYEGRATATLTLVDADAGEEASAGADGTCAPGVGAVALLALLAVMPASQGRRRLRRPG